MTNALLSRIFPRLAPAARIRIAMLLVFFFSVCCDWFYRTQVQINMVLNAKDFRVSTEANVNVSLPNLWKRLMEEGQMAACTSLIWKVQIFEKKKVSKKLN